MSNGSIWIIERALSGATTLSGPGSDANEIILHIPQSITGVQPSDCLLSDPGHSLVESYPIAERQSVYYTAPSDWDNLLNSKCIYLTITSCSNVRLATMIGTQCSYIYKLIRFSS